LGKKQISKRLVCTWTKKLRPIPTKLLIKRKNFHKSGLKVKNGSFTFIEIQYLSNPNNIKEFLILLVHIKIYL